ncbi:MBL fold metallo-hydrolase RNA specificity domain-containing protein [Sulfurihydrogenibium subterraneum]|uniref:MBL fold metallo-hydrolase RNA specificity domain-containing protein n=1 Tax=Sulfurihydrogenibium subterraneum TaxID=171121 RepID=UPI00048A9A8D|nr:MBL fold metallo-hydrolase [Sulfurihydrogenibium subterraneum]
MIVQSFGGVEGITGSCHLVKVDHMNILIDCGMFQGLEEDKNYEPFGFNPKDIDYLILTHAHIDHCGRIPLLVKQGFRGKIISTRATYAVARIMLLDASKVMAEEYKVNYKKALRRGKPEEAKPPLYDEDDVFEAMEYFKVLLEYNEKYKLSKNVEIIFRNAGHILGSGYVELTVKENSNTKKIIFSGDLGIDNKLVIKPIDYPKNADVLFIESTYGNRNHKPLDQTIEEFKTAIIESFKDGGNVVIPTFALERAQEILFILRKMYDNAELPQCKIFLDSPLAISATKLFLQFPNQLNGEVLEYLKRGQNPFVFPWVNFTESVEASRKINDIESGAIIMAGSGMCNGGRIKHHLKHNLWRENSSVIFVGYQAKGTLGRQIVDGAKVVKIYGEEVAVKARIYTINGFSAHADQSSLIKFIKTTKDLQSVFLIHGEPEVMQVFKEKVKEETNLNPHIVKLKEYVYL